MFKEVGLFNNDNKIKSHPDFDYPIIVDEKGEQWLEKGADENYVIGPYYLDDFQLDKIVENKDKKADYLIESAMPIMEENQRFSDLEILRGVKNTSLDIQPNNINADLGLQKRIRDMVEQKIIDKKSLVVLSHGHFIAGNVELSKVKTEDGKYMFDTSVYFPRGGWSDDKSEPVVRQQFQLWSEELKKAKDDNRENKNGHGGGVAIALFGHRGRFDYGNNNATAYIDPNELFGSVEEMDYFLKSHNLDKVVIITEEPALDPDVINKLPLERLKEGVFSEENKDLYDYFNKLKLSGVNVEVVNGNTRPPMGCLAKKLAELDNGLANAEKIID